MSLQSIYAYNMHKERGELIVMRWSQLVYSLIYRITYIWKFIVHINFIACLNLDEWNGEFSRFHNFLIPIPTCFFFGLSLLINSTTRALGWENWLRFSIKNKMPSGLKERERCEERKESRIFIEWKWDLQSEWRQMSDVTTHSITSSSILTMHNGFNHL